MRAKSELRSAQVRTVTRFYECDEVQAILPMGGGKTAAALTAFKERLDDKVSDVMYVMAPKRVANMVWPKEALEWEHLQHVKIVNVHGPEHKRLQQLRTPAAVYTIGVDFAQWFAEWMKTKGQQHFAKSIFCIDESSRFKDPRGKRLKALFPLMDWFQARWQLTGTPRPNGYDDEFGQMKLLTSGRLWGRSFDRWQREHMYPLDYMGYKWRLIDEKVPAIIADLNKVAITIGPEDMPDVPELSDGPDMIEWIELPPDVRATYDEMEKELIAKLKKRGKHIIAQNMGVATGKLAQIVQGFLYDSDGVREVERLHDEKMMRLLDMIEEAGGEPVMIAYDFNEDRDRLQLEFPGAPYLGKSDKADAEYERAWNAKELPIALIHPASGGHGLNLQFGGRQLFWYGLTWSSELYDQLLKRFHRPGQKLPVFSRPIMARGTVDEIKYARVHDKISEQEAFRRLIKEV